MLLFQLLSTPTHWLFWNYFSSLITHFYTFFFLEKKTNKSQVFFGVFKVLLYYKINSMFVKRMHGISKLVNFLYPILMTHHNNKMQKRKALSNCWLLLWQVATFSARKKRLPREWKFLQLSSSLHSQTTRKERVSKTQWISRKKFQKRQWPQKRSVE